ncbi:MAG: alr0857 family protein [Rivularia sp. (in: cyanobacteria)]
MLKLTYTENSFYLELLTQPIEEWIQAFCILSLRVGQSLCVEPSTACFLLPANLPGLGQLRSQIKQNTNGEIIDIYACDTEYVEVTLRGYWLSVSAQSINGGFVTTMNHSTECFLHQLWLEALEEGKRQKAFMQE